MIPNDNHRPSRRPVRRLGRSLGRKLLALAAAAGYLAGTLAVVGLVPADLAPLTLGALILLPFAVIVVLGARRGTWR